MHTNQSYPSQLGYFEFHAQQASPLNFSGRQLELGSKFPGAYNPNRKNRPNFSWRNQQHTNQLRPVAPPSNPLGFQQSFPSQPQPHQSQTSSLDDTLKAFMHTSNQILQSNSKAIAKLGTQIG